MASSDKGISVKSMNKWKQFQPVGWILFSAARVPNPTFLPVAGERVLQTTAASRAVPISSSPALVSPVSLFARFSSFSKFYFVVCFFLSWSAPHLSLVSVVLVYLHYNLVFSLWKKNFFVGCMPSRKLEVLLACYRAVIGRKSLGLTIFRIFFYGFGGEDFEWLFSVARLRSGILVVRKVRFFLTWWVGGLCP